MNSLEDKDNQIDDIIIKLPWHLFNYKDISQRRIAILNILKEEKLNNTKIITKISRKNKSLTKKQIQHDIRRLTELGLINQKKEGKCKINSLTPAGMMALNYKHK